MTIFSISKAFPKEETYSLTDQTRRSSRSVCANIAEAYRKRIYPKHFLSKLTDADGECSETIVHLNFAKDCGYLEENSFRNIQQGYFEVGKIFGIIINNPKNFITTN